MAAVAAVLGDPVFWDRYLRAYTFESYVANPFPEPQRLYPQERVPGAERVRELARAAPSDRSISAAALEAAERFAQRTRSTALLVYHDGAVALERYWLGARPDRAVYSFSMHKSVVALLVGIAIEEGYIGGVDDALGAYLREWRFDPRGRITIRQALQMASGLEPMRFPRHPFSKHVRRQIGTDLAAAALSYRLQDPPGSVFRYNGVNPTLLVMVLEAATGQRYAHYLSERLWRPVGNRDAAVWLDRPAGLARGATSLYAVPMDWLRLGVMLLDGGRVGGRRVVPGHWIREMTRPSPANPLYGYLVWIGRKHAPERTLAAFEGFKASAQAPFAAEDVFYFDGLGGQRVYVVPSRRLVIVRTGVLAREWEDATLPNLLIEGLAGGAGAAAALQ